jgi:TetR/AcrR family transcriptional regulator of autoinduction and epiphytic fitness
MGAGRPLEQLPGQPRPVAGSRSVPDSPPPRRDPATPNIGRHFDDARLAKGDRTRQVVLDAVVTLLGERRTEPTMGDVAARAHVSIRIVYYHFGGIGDLLVAATAFQSDRHRGLLFAIPPRGPSDIRISALCRQRRLYFEEITPVLTAALAKVDRRLGFIDLLADDRTLLRDQLASTLGPELHRRGVRSAETLDALDHATGWDTWRALRHVSGHSMASAERVMAMTAACLLA